MATVTAVRERPILFSGEMVRAILEGRKTQTRRVMKHQPYSNGIRYDRELGDIICHEDSYPPSATLYRGGWLGQDAGELSDCPYGQPGDRLWVRETWAPGWTYMGEYPCVFYRADGTAIIGSESLGLRPYGKSAASPPAGLRWKPSIFMPRWASRITLEVTSVRVERVQEIAPDDISAEGVVLWSAVDNRSRHEDRERFARLWDQINGSRGFGWGVNPWVWVIGFRPLTTTDAESEHG